MITQFGRRILLSIDAQGYGERDDQRQGAMQDGLLTVLDAAAATAGLARGDWLRQGAGDSELAILPGSEPEPVVVDGFVRELHSALVRHNRDLVPGAQLRLRLAIHHGVAIQAGNGYRGQGVVAVSRLCDSAVLRAALRQATEPLAVLLSRRVYEDTVVQGHTSLRPGELRAVRIANKEFAESAWLRVPGADVYQLDLPELDLPEPVVGEQGPGAQPDEAQSIPAQNGAPGWIGGSAGRDIGINITNVRNG